MDRLRRLFRAGEAPEAGAATAADPAELESFERERELELLRDEAASHDELIERQLRYARFAWQPPAQGGARRADDGESPVSD